MELNIDEYCHLFNRFDVGLVSGDGFPAYTFPPLGMDTYDAAVQASGTNTMGYERKTMWFGFSFNRMCEEEPEGSPGDPINRNVILACVLEWMGKSVNVDISGGDPPAYANSLSQNYPNPFNPVTTIRFSLKETRHVVVRIYDVSGRLVKTLVDDTREAGLHRVTWDGVNKRGAAVSSGLYLYRMETKDFIETRKMLLLR
jgi:hypothetical protein